MQLVLELDLSRNQGALKLQTTAFPFWMIWVHHFERSTVALESLAKGDVGPWGRGA